MVWGSRDLQGHGSHLGEIREIGKVPMQRLWGPWSTERCRNARSVKYSHEFGRSEFRMVLGWRVGALDFPLRLTPLLLGWLLWGILGGAFMQWLDLGAAGSAILQWAKEVQRLP